MFDIQYYEDQEYELNARYDYVREAYGELARDCDRMAAEDAAFYDRQHMEWFLDEVELGGAQYEKAWTGRLLDDACPF